MCNVCIVESVVIHALCLIYNRFGMSNFRYYTVLNASVFSIMINELLDELMLAYYILSLRC